MPRRFEWRYEDDSRLNGGNWFENHGDPATERCLTLTAVVMSVDDPVWCVTAHAGVLRDAESLASAAAVVDEVLATPRGDTVADHELHNLATVGRAAVAAAARRTESRGAHTREDFPDTLDDLRHRIVFV